MRVDSGVPRAQGRLVSFSLPLPTELDVGLSAAFPVPCLPVCCHDHCCEDDGLNF